MSLTAIGFGVALVAALGWSALDALRKRVADDVSASAAVAALSVFQLPLLLGLILAGEFLNATGEPWTTIAPPLPELDLGYVPLLVGTVFLNVAGNWLFLRAVQISPLSLTVPYLSFTPVFTVVLGIFVLEQTPSVWAGLGIVVVTIGAFLLQAGGGRHPVRALFDERGSVYMLVVALIWSITPILDKLAVDRAGVPVHSALLATGLFVAFWLVRAVRDRDPLTMVSEFRAAPRLLFAGGCILVVAMVLQLTAYSFIDVAYVETVKRGVGVIAAVLLGWAAFAERGIAWRLFAAFVMAAGVAMIMLGPYAFRWRWRTQSTTPTAGYAVGVVSRLEGDTVSRRSLLRGC